MKFHFVPYTPNKKALAEMNIALVTTAGVHRVDQHPFRLDKDKPDISHRVIAKETDVRQLTITNAAPPHEYDPCVSKEDINTVFPLESLHDLAMLGVIGGVADFHYSYMGYMYRFKDLIDRGVPPVIKKIVRSNTDAVLLSAGSPYCHRTVVIIQRAIEMEGIPTILVTVEPNKSGMYKPPRAVYPLQGKIGQSFGPPGDRELQLEIVSFALHQLTIVNTPGVTVTYNCSKIV